MPSATVPHQISTGPSLSVCLGLLLTLFKQTSKRPWATTDNKKLSLILFFDILSPEAGGMTTTHPPTSSVQKKIPASTTRSKITLLVHSKLVHSNWVVVHSNLEPLLLELL